MRKNHKYSKSVNVLPSTKLQRQVKSVNQQQILLLPQIHKKSKHDYSLQPCLLPIIFGEESQFQQLKHANSLRYCELATQIKQRVKLLNSLKQKIIQYNDNLFIRKVISQIRNTSYGSIMMDMWKDSWNFQHNTAESLMRIQKRYQVQLDDDFLKSMDYVNNVCRFILADYKKRQWKNTENQKNRLRMKLNDNISKMCKKIEFIENPNTKLELIIGLQSLNQNYSSKNRIYMDWRQKALNKLRSSKIQCQMLSAEVFQEGFMN